VTAAVRRDGSEVLTTRALNRALLERQFLLQRSRLGVLDTVEHLLGLQAQNPRDPYIALWSRLEGFRPEELAGMMTARQVVRIGLMRSTIHLVSAADCRTFRPLFEPVMVRSMRGQFGKHLADVDPGELVAAGRELVESEPSTIGGIGKRLAERWPGRDHQALGNAVRAWVPLVQLPPRGVWGRSGRALHTTAESWLGGPMDPDPSIDAVVLRYLRAFGPATVNDIRQWCGLTRLREVVERLRPGLRIFADEKGRELFDLPDAPRPDPDTPAPVRFLPEYDNLMLSHADRSRVITEDDGRVYSQLLTGGAGLGLAAITLDGFLLGTWRLTMNNRNNKNSKGSAVLTIWPFRRPLPADRSALEEEAARLLAFMAPGAPAAEIEIRDLDRSPAS
jgi:hypothetical protein